MTAETLKPADAAQVAEAITWAVASEIPLELLSGGTKRGLGHPPGNGRRLDLSALSGVTLYEPEELVLTAAAGTPLAEVEALLAEHGQQLAFEPADFGPLYGGAPGRQTLAGVIACNLAGPRRIKSGAARDHFLGVAAVSGRGEIFKSGGRVVKNVTGYDMCKLLAGSYGTLAAMTEVTLKVMPAPEKTRTILIFGLDDGAAAAAMSEALQSPHEVSAAAHLPRAMATFSSVSYVADGETAVTALRVEGPEASALHRAAALRDMFAARGKVEELHGKNSASFWREVRDVAAFHGTEGAPLWRISVPPTAGPGVVAEVSESVAATAYYDWGGGLVWLAVSADAAEAGAGAVRAAITQCGGHATLMRAPDGLRAAVPVFQPQPAPLAALSWRVKSSFDPNGVLNPGRMYDGV